MFKEVDTHNELSFIVDAQVLMAKETENLVLDKDIVTKGVNHLYNTPALGRYYIYYNSKNEPLACLLTTFEWSDWRNATCLWIQSVYVLPENRGKGIFKEMYAHLKSQVEESSEYSGLRLYVDKSNKKAQSVYDAVGMSKEHYELYEWLK